MFEIVDKRMGYNETKAEKVRNLPNKLVLIERGMRIRRDTKIN